MEERLQKLLSAAGICSRRAAEAYITAGRVTVNGHPAVLGERAGPDRDTILVLLDAADQEREKRWQKAVLDIKKKYGKNAILRGMNFEDGATARERNGQIGGHKK